MYQFQQLTGKFTNLSTLEVLGFGYSGNGIGKNVPAMEDDQGLGPIPQGLYTIGEPFTSPARGSLVMHLIPDQLNEMFGRSGFLIHGDSISALGTASKGCIILSRVIREKIAQGTDRRLQVVAD